jgi:glutamate carboxypeptidase
MSFEGGGPPDNDNLSLATSGSANAIITVRGRASHSGSAPHLGVNAVDELAHQILQNRDLSDPAIGLRANWTLARGGIVANMIPPTAQATLNVRVLRVEDLDGVEAKLRERIKSRLLPQAVVELNFERGRRRSRRSRFPARLRCTARRSMPRSARCSTCRIPRAEAAPTRPMRA